MDGGYLEAEMMAKAGADFVVVMGRAHEATIRRVVDAGRDFGIKVMGDNLASADRVESARWLESLGVDVIVHHIGFDERGMIAGPEPARRAGRRRARGLHPGAGGRRPVDRAGDRMRPHGAPLVVLRRAARDRRRRVPAADCEPVSRR